MSSYRQRLASIRFSAHSRWVYGLLFPWFIPLIGYLLFGYRYISELPVFLTATAINLSIGTLTFFTMDALVVGITRKYPRLNQTLYRVLGMLAAFMVVTTIVILAGFWLYASFSILNYQLQWTTLQNILLLNLLANLVSVGVYEGVYSVTEWKASMQEKEQLRKINLQSQLDSLRNQVDPHFMFNSLNSLSSLIQMDSKRAETYVEELSNVYRYLLQANQHDLSSLEEELRFVKSYYHLLKIKFGEALQLEIQVAPNALSLMLPPLCLQLLLENAVKHNVVKQSKPMLVEIMTLKDARLQVRNQLQRKQEPVVSHQVGLSNIAAKYQLLSQRGVEIEETDRHFSVIIPLLDPVAQQT